MQEQQYLDDLAVRAAVAGWQGGEAAFSASFKSKTIVSAELLNRWLAFWGLGDRLRRDQREQFRDFLERAARPALCNILDAGPDAWALVDDLNFQAVQEKLTTASLMSLLTRFACSCEPTVFAPATQHSRRGIQVLCRNHPDGRKLSDMSYRSFMIAFMREQERFASRIATALLKLPSTAANGTPLPADVITMRAFDRRLMLLGGYTPARMEQEVARLQSAGGTRPAERRSRSAAAGKA
ncbi:hypothetical protein A33M_1418 [Rhodovulum sp. PH10]|uniref:hypothetical protein n=1 Tax=Rhodovulum sp. PH10 TaxID=1187851 RepID=UPI00027C2ADC|nr:hypothetical protein [Rhodovulum sp. PH10]EJW12856.1 hypothetical protein A33M_1418 [Rhodovulum sp. PH10]